MAGSVQHPPGATIDGVHFRPHKAIAYWRNRRNLTQVQCAAKVGASLGGWQKWESGERTPGVDLWIKIAAVLRVNVADLLGTEFAGFEPADPVASDAVLDIQDAIIGLPSLVEVRENEDRLLREDVARAWHRWQTTGDDRFTLVGAAIPNLITRAQSASAAYTGDAWRGVQVTANSLYQLTWAYLRARGALSWARDAAAMARIAASNSGDRAVVAAGEWGYAAVLSSNHATDAAYRLLDKTIRTFEPELADEGPALWEVVGQMKLLIAVQAIRLQRPADAQSHLSSAAAIANRVQASNTHHTDFGILNAEIHATTVAMEAGKYKTAVTLGESVDVEAVYSMERKVAFLVQLAHAYLRAGRVREAVESLGQAVDLSKRETASLRLAQETAWNVAPKRAPAFAKRLDYVMSSLGIAS